jgi:hypothetical protein
MAELLPHHLDQLLRDSGIAQAIIDARGYQSLHYPGSFSLVKPLGFTRAQCRLPALLIPVLGLDGSPVLHQLRPDDPRLDKDNHPVKYETPKGAGMRLDMGVGQAEPLANPKVPLWITEGIKKVDALASHGVCAVGLLGVWNFKGKNAAGSVTVLADWDCIALKGRQVRVVFDNDVMTKPQVQKALQRLTEHLQRKGAHVQAAYLPTEGGKKIGVDDYLRTHSPEDLEGLVEARRPTPQPAKPIMRLLQDFPKVMTRPLQLIEDHAYAATWLPFEKTVTELPSKDGEVIRLAQPRVTTERLLVVARDDGLLYAELDDKAIAPLSSLGFTVTLSDDQPNPLLWSPKGVIRHRQRQHHDYKAIFGWVADLYDYYIDFTGSWGSQEVMCELSGCLTFMTWVADAFTIMPYAWATSPGPGSGKTKWGILWTKTSYLGYATTMGGTFAALRDLAEAGATLLFDDAEMLAELQEVDPDKRELVLAGNRKGVQIPVKEPIPGGGWRTRWMNAYCPRGFTAIGLPTGALESRCLVLPFVKTADPERANRDPASEEVWPIERRDLIDALWGMGVSLLPEAAQVWRELADERDLIGRAFEPWRAVIAVAKLMERQGVAGLEGHMRQLMHAYQHEKHAIIAVDPISLVIRAVLRLIPDVPDMADVLTFLSETPLREYRFKTSEITKTVFQVAKDYDAAVELGEHAGRKIGHLLSKLRFTKADEEDSRGWKITSVDLVRLARAYGISTMHSLERPPHRKNVRMSGTSGMSERCPTCGGWDWEDIPGGDAVCRACARRAK